MVIPTAIPLPPLSKIFRSAAPPAGVDDLKVTVGQLVNRVKALESQIAQFGTTFKGNDSFLSTPPPETPGMDDDLPF